MVLVVSRENSNHVRKELTAEGETVWEIGHLCPRKDAKGCVLTNLEIWDTV
jgi:phosphoribosylaminoimidazole (AIR) synthetase